MVIQWSNKVSPLEHKGSVQAGGAETIGTQGNSAAALLGSVGGAEETEGGAEAKRLGGAGTTETGEGRRPTKASMQCPTETLKINIVLTKQLIVRTELILV